MSDEGPITPAKVKKWLEDEAKYKRDLSDIQRKLSAAGVLYPEAVKAGTALALSGRMTSVTATATVTDMFAEARDEGGGLTDAMERIANSSAAPLSKKELKKKLSEAGIGDGGAYFYTAISRLKTRKRISVTPDGKVWRVAQ